VAQAVVPGCSLSDDPGFCRAPNPQPSHEFVERASTTAIANEPGPPQDFGPRDVGILAQPLRDLSRELGYEEGRTISDALYFIREPWEQCR
jgi:hypothetical protein